MVREADVVLSIVPPAEAESVAAALAGARLFADLNAISPATAPADLAGGRRLDLRPARPGSRHDADLPLRAAAREVAALPFEGVEVVVVGDEAGAASAVKMSTASVYKGSAALLTQALRAADHYGVLEHVLDDLGDLADERGPADRAGGGEVGPLRRRDARDRRRAGGRRAHAGAVRGDGGGLRGGGGNRRSARLHPRMPAPISGRCCGSSR